MFLDLLHSRRSIRKYRDREVEKDKVEIILKSGLLAPSSRARRPWEFIAVTDKKLLQQLSGCREGSSAFLAGAPLGIVVAADSALCDVWVEDASIASIIMQLSAQSLGLSSCWIQVRERFHTDGQRAEDYVKRILRIPEKYSIECMVAVGYAAEDKQGYGEGDLPYGKIHFNGF